MITRFKIFELWYDNPLGENPMTDITPEFWKMVRTVKWNSIIKAHKEHSKNYWNIINTQKNPKRFDAIKLGQKNLYFKYELQEILKFKDEYDKLYQRLYEYFWAVSDRCDVSDDGYTDLISSVIGKGKTWVQKCINDPELVVNMGENGDYLENFGYLFLTAEEDYWNIKCKYDPFCRDVRKYNL